MNRWIVTGFLVALAAGVMILRNSEHISDTVSSSVIAVLIILALLWNVVGARGSKRTR